MFQHSLEAQLAQQVGALPQLDLASTVQLEFISNFQAIQVGVRNQFGYIKSGSSENTTMTMSKQPPIARPMSASGASPTTLSSVFSQLSNSVMAGLSATTVSSSHAVGAAPLVPKDVTANMAPVSMDFQNNYMAFPSVNMEHTVPAMSTSPLEFLESLTSSVPTSATGGLQDFVSSITNSMAQNGLPQASLATPVPSAPIAYPPKAQIRRQKMIYHCKVFHLSVII